jgi:hypothetical protein
MHLFWIRRLTTTRHFSLEASVVRSTLLCGFPGIKPLAPSPGSDDYRSLVLYLTAQILFFLCTSQGLNPMHVSLIQRLLGHCAPDLTAWRDFAISAIASMGCSLLCSSNFRFLNVWISKGLNPMCLFLIQWLLGIGARWTVQICPPCALSSCCLDVDSTVQIFLPSADPTTPVLFLLSFLGFLT